MNLLVVRVNEQRAVRRQRPLRLFGGGIEVERLLMISRLGVELVDVLARQGHERGVRGRRDVGVGHR